MPVSCTVCHQSFGRQEHLTRHMRIHTHEKPYRCSYCEKRFSRLDVLSRHKASHEEQSATPATPVSSRACKQCARDRVRCSRSLPCKRCSIRQLTCCYPAGCNTMPLNGDSERRSSQPMDMAESPNLIIDRSTTTTEPQDNNGDSTLPIADGSIAPATSGSVVDHADDRTIWGDVFDTFSNVYDYDLHGLGLSSINWISPGYQYETIWNPLSYPACEPPQMHSPDVQIADTTVEFTQSGGNHVSQPEHPGTSLSIDAHNRNEADDAATQQSIRGEYYVDGDGPRAPFRGRYHGRGSVSNGRRPLSPAAATPAEGAQSIHQRELCSQEAYNNLIQNCMQEAAHLESYTPVPQYPSHAQIELYVQHYFDEFDPILPFLRRASFREVDSMHWLLLLAVAITGSKYVCPPEDVPVELLAILETTLRRNRDSCENLSPQLSDNESYGSVRKACNYASIDIHVLQAAILFFALHLRIGQTTGFNKVLRWRSYLVETCDSLGLLRHSDSDQSDGFQLSAGSSLQDWLQHESKIRTGMTIWFLDSTMMYEFGLRPLMALDDARANLPSCDDIWRTSTHTQKDNINRPSLTLAEALEVLYIEKRLPAKLSEFSVGLVIHAIFRRTKTMLSQATRLDSWTPSATPQSRTNSESAAAHPSWLPSTSIASKWRNSACDALDILHWHANSKVAKSTGFEHHTILHLHLARIIILTPTDCIKALAVTLSTTFSEGNWSKYRAQIASARTELFLWAVRDRYKARLAVIHCASLYWHVRRYSCDSIHEPYAIYIATLVLWAFGVAAQLPEVSEVFGRDDGNEPDPSFCHLDRPLDDELVQLFVRVGHRMCPYLSRVGNIFLPGAASKILAVGVDLLGPNPQTPPAQTSTVDTMRRITWGIEETYAQTLNALHGTAIRCSTATDTNSLEFPWNLASS